MPYSWYLVESKIVATVTMVPGRATTITVPIARQCDFDFRYSGFSLCAPCDGMGADCEFTNIRVVASKKKGLRVNRERRGLGSEVKEVRGKC